VQELKNHKNEQSEVVEEYLQAFESQCLGSYAAVAREDWYARLGAYNPESIRIGMRKVLAVSTKKLPGLEEVVRIVREIEGKPLRGASADPIDKNVNRPDFQFCSEGVKIVAKYSSRSLGGPFGPDVAEEYARKYCNEMQELYIRAGVSFDYGRVLATRVNLYRTK